MNELKYLVIYGIPFVLIAFGCLLFLMSKSQKKNVKHAERGYNQP